MTLDDLTQQLVGRPTLQQFCEEALRSNYQPTFQGGGDIAAKHRLADAFDEKMAELGSRTRAHRCNCGCFPRPEGV